MTKKLLALLLAAAMPVCAAEDVTEYRIDEIGLRQRQRQCSVHPSRGEHQRLRSCSGHQRCSRRKRAENRRAAEHHRLVCLC